MTNKQNTRDIITNSKEILFADGKLYIDGKLHGTMTTDATLEFSSSKLPIEEPKITGDAKNVITVRLYAVQ